MTVYLPVAGVEPVHGSADVFVSRCSIMTEILTGGFISLSKLFLMSIRILPVLSCWFCIKLSS